MASLIGSLTESNRTNVDARTQVNLGGQPFKTFKFSTDNFQVQHQATVVSQKNIGGDVLIWGNSALGQWGQFKWGTQASQSFILGLSLLGVNALGDKSSEYEIVRVSPPNNSFNEPFLTTYFIDTDETTATVSGGTVTF